MPPSLEQMLDGQLDWEWDLDSDLPTFDRQVRLESPEGGAGLNAAGESPVPKVPLPPGVKRRSRLNSVQNAWSGKTPSASSSASPMRRRPASDSSARSPGRSPGKHSRPHTTDITPETGLPPAVLFPADKPSSRADAVILDQWVNRAFSAYAQKSAQRSSQEDIMQVVEDMVPILSIGLHEVVRQATHHCLERGLVLEKIWRTYVELFERALNEARSSLRRHKERTGKVEAALLKTNNELAELRHKHPEQIDKLSRTLAAKFKQRTHELEEQLRQLRVENTVLSRSIKDQSGSVRAWFPQFEIYKDSSLRSELVCAPPNTPQERLPEAGIAEDFKRIMLVLPPERRRRVGFFVCSLLGLRFEQLPVGRDGIEDLTARRDHNVKEIEMLEHRLVALKQSLAP